MVSLQGNLMPSCLDFTCVTNVIFSLEMKSQSLQAIILLNIKKGLALPLPIQNMLIQAINDTKMKQCLLSTERARQSVDGYPFKTAVAWPPVELLT